MSENTFQPDGHVCKCCKGKSKDMILNVHHLESGKTGSDSPGNLITLCETCHKGYHKGLASLDGIEKANAYKAETFMGLVTFHETSPDLIFCRLTVSTSKLFFSAVRQPMHENTTTILNLVTK